ncbi:CPBP family intramembrane glutamic endopeptidase [Rhodanobacter lindaniclasticus]
MQNRWRAAFAFVVLWLYKLAEGVGGRWLHSYPVQAGLMLACVLLAWPLSRWLGYRGYGAYALTRRHGWQTWLSAGLLLAVLAKFGVVWLGLHLGVYTADAATQTNALTALSSALPLLLLATFVASLAEDILTRGFWYRAAGIRWRGGVVFVLASSAIYVLSQITLMGNGPLEWLTLFCFGLAYAAALWRSGSLWAAVGLHWGWNLGNGLVDAALPASVADARLAPWLSIGAHLLLLLLVLALPRSRAGSQVVDERQ